MRFRARPSTGGRRGLRADRTPAGPTRGRGGRMSNFIVTIAVFLITDHRRAVCRSPTSSTGTAIAACSRRRPRACLGREVRVGGAVNLHLLPTPYFRFEKVRIADTSVNLQEPFFRADSLTIKLSIPPMFRGAIEANEIELQRPVLRLALDSDDGWNWQSFGQAARQAAYLPTNVALTSVKIVDGVLAAARTRRHGAHALRGLERRALGAGARWPLSVPRHLRQGPRRARAEDCHGAAGARRLGALQGDRCGSATAPRPTPWMAAWPT